MLIKRQRPTPPPLSLHPIIAFKVCIGKSLEPCSVCGEGNALGTHWNPRLHHIWDRPAIIYNCHPNTDSKTFFSKHQEKPGTIKPNSRQDGAGRKAATAQTRARRLHRHSRRADNDNQSLAITTSLESFLSRHPAGLLHCKNSNERWKLALLLRDKSWRDATLGWNIKHCLLPAVTKAVVERTMPCGVSLKLIALRFLPSGLVFHTLWLFVASKCVKPTLASCFLTFCICF